MNKKGFTLIEIIIVIVILGILATLALPRITGQMESAKAAEVLNLFGTLRRSAMDCADSANQVSTNCWRWADLGMTKASTTNFTYTATFNSAAAPNVITFNAQHVSRAAHICMQVNASDGSTTYSFLGTTFQGIVTRIGTANLNATTCAQLSTAM